MGGVENTQDFMRIFMVPGMYHFSLARSCPYPQVAKYSGSGDTTDAANFVCTNPQP